MKTVDIISKIFKKPKALLLAITYLLTLAFSAGSVAMLFIDFESSIALSILAYTLFALAAVFLFYTVYTVVLYSSKIKESIIGILERSKFGRQMLGNFGFRTVIYAALSFVVSIAFGFFNGALGIIYSSVWYGALAGYYILLSLTRGSLLILGRKNLREGSENIDIISVAKAYRNSGIFLLLLNLALSTAIAQMIFEDRAFSYPGWIIYGFAAYTFIKMTMAIVNMYRARMQEDLVVTGIRDINLIDALVSILALQTALLQAFSNEDVSVSLFNILTGAFVSLFTVLFSIYMITKSQKIIKENDGKNGKQ